MQLSILSLLVSLLVSLALAHPAAPASPTHTPPFLVSPPLPPPLPLLKKNNNHITGNFSHSCNQITLMNKYFLAATCSPIEPEPAPAVVSGGPEEGEERGKGEGEQHVPSPAEEFSQLDLNMCIGFDQGSGGGGGGGNGVHAPGKLIWQVLGKFANYCTDCNLTTGPELSELKCSCVPMTAGSGATVITVLDLDEGVENRNGTLVCRGGMGSGIGPGPLSA